MRLAGAIIVLTALVSSLLGAFIAGTWSGSPYSKLAGVDSLRSEVSGLRSSLEGERARAERLEAELLQLRMELGRANMTMDMLRRRLDTANTTVLLLRDRLGHANSTITVLRQRLEEANASLARLGMEVERLRAMLEERNATLEEISARLQEAWLQLNTTREELWELVNMSLEVLGWYGVPEDIPPQELLETAPGTVQDLAQEVLGGLESTEERVKAVMDWIALHTYYQNDSHARILRPEGPSVEVRSEIFMLPDETVENAGGDCDDLAVLAYSLLRAVPLPGERVYLLIIRGFDWAHMAVAVKSPEGLYYILDPAGNYLNSVSVMLKMVVENQSDMEDYYVWLSAPHLPPWVKSFLINNSLAWIVYYEEGLFYPWDSPEWPDNIAYTDPDDLLWDWQWTTGLWPALSYEIMNETVYKAFDSRQELAQWLASQ